MIIFILNIYHKSNLVTGSINERFKTSTNHTYIQFRFIFCYNLTKRNTLKKKYMLEIYIYFILIFHMTSINFKLKFFKLMIF